MAYPGNTFGYAGTSQSHTGKIQCTVWRTGNGRLIGRLAVGFSRSEQYPDQTNRWSHDLLEHSSRLIGSHALQEMDRCPWLGREMQTNALIFREVTCLYTQPPCNPFTAARAAAILRPPPDCHNLQTLLLTELGVLACSLRFAIFTDMYHVISIMGQTSHESHGRVLTVSTTSVSNNHIMCLQIRRFRDILEWGHAGPLVAADTASDSAHVHIFFPFPAPGRFHKASKGITAGQALQQVSF